MYPAPDVSSRPRVGISACLLGQRVRYDGDHRRDPFITGILAGAFAWVPVCPEIEAGFGVPREAVQLEGEPDAPRMIGIVSRRDRTAEMTGAAQLRIEDLARSCIAGFVFKRRSPSCGPAGVKLFAVPQSGSQRPGSQQSGSQQSGAPMLRGDFAAGLFARLLETRLPGLPVADEEMLRDPAFARDFVRRVRVRAAAPAPGIPPG